MAQLVVRNLDDRLKDRLRREAAAQGRSMEEQVRVILHRALPEGVSHDSPESHIGLGSTIHALFTDIDIPDEYFAAVDSLRSGTAPGTATPRAAELDE